MAKPVIMPRQGQSVETCILTGWFKQKGDQVKTGELLFSYETDKAAFDEESKDEGILLEQFYQPGDEVPVLSNIAVVGEVGEDPEPFRPGKSGIRAEPGITAGKNGAHGIPRPVQDVRGTLPDEEGRGGISPRATGLAAKLGLPLQGITGSGPSGRIIERDILSAARDQPKITPLAREKMKRDHLVYDNRLKAGRRITTKDLVKPAVQPETDAEIRPLSNIRKKIAEATQQSLQHAAQLTHHTSADARKILSLREKVKEKRETGEVPDITLNDMVCFAAIRAVKKHPAVNCHFLGDHMKLFRKVNLGFAVDTERGLMVPAVLNAGDLSLAELSLRLKELAGRCRKGNIDPDLLLPEAAGFTVSNLGAYGVEMFTPVLNLPQTAILGVNTIINRPADTGGGVVGLVPFIGLSLTYDHRALDGGPASLFLKEVKEEVEKFNVEEVNSE